MTNSSPSDPAQAAAAMARAPGSHPETNAPSLRSDYIARNQTRFLEAVNRFNRESPPGPSGVFAGLFAFHWLRQEIHPRYRQAILAVSRNPDHAWLADLLDQAPDPEHFVSRFLDHWQHAPPDHPKAAALRNWHLQHPVDPQAAILAIWQRMTPFRHALQVGIRHIQSRQKEIAAETGGPLDQERMALVDHLPSPGTVRPWSKVGFIPRMACSQSCRHCLFVWRDPIRHPLDPTPLLHWIDQQTSSLLFTGGELHDQLPLFHQAIREMERVQAFAILLNGASADSLDAARTLFGSLEEARTRRSARSRPATITLQISCDEYHQEILAHRDGSFQERIPVAHIAHLIRASVDFPHIRLVLLHKQNRLNFSRALLEQGVIARLIRTLQAQGEELRLIRHALSPRPKADPVDRNRTGPIIRDAVFALASHPDHPIHWMSSTLDAYGRAALLDPSEYVNERLYLREILDHGAPDGERFDTDPMIRADGMVSCFGANHLWLGDLGQESRETIRARHGKDPLLQALERFDPRVPRFYQECAQDLETRIAQATGPHHLWHLLTERAAMRLYLTRRLLGIPG
ncbi:MAG: hypothetical protein HQL99_12615 [Magnetococcales bacterium]|nr:hypothetical protein [Magnetococcales bacterium]